MEAKLARLIESTDFEKLFAKLGFVFFTRGDYNVNIIGIRNLLGGNVQDDTFNDAMVVIYKENGEWVKKIWEVTTDPSLKLLKSPSNSKGTAILVPGQYRSTYKIDLHNGKYKALCQRLKPVSVYRDRNKDNRLDMDKSTIQTGMFGINIHRASSSGTTKNVGPYSAGCQVFASVNDFNEFMRLVERSADIFGNSFTYTLLTTNEL